MTEFLIQWPPPLGFGCCCRYTPLRRAALPVAAHTHQHPRDGTDGAEEDGERGEVGVDDGSEPAAAMVVVGRSAHPSGYPSEWAGGVRAFPSGSMNGGPDQEVDDAPSGSVDGATTSVGVADTGCTV